jgi:hypothetical protein
MENFYETVYKFPFGSGCRFCWIELNHTEQSLELSGHIIAMSTVLLVLSYWSVPPNTFFLWKHTHTHTHIGLAQHYLASPLQPWRRKKSVSPKRWYLTASIHGVATQKNDIITVYSRPERAYLLPICELVITIMNCYSSVSGTSFYTHSDHKNLIAVVLVSGIRVTVLWLRKRQRNANRFKWENVHTVYTCHFFRGDIWLS